jgi:tetratricopeptide (TPR) repeat protein
MSFLTPPEYLGKDLRAKLYTFCIGSAYFSRSEYKKCKDANDKAIELKPDCGSAYYNRATAYLNMMQYENAIKDYTKAIELEPDNALAYYYRGHSKQKLSTYYGRKELYADGWEDKVTAGFASIIRSEKKEGPSEDMPFLYVAFRYEVSKKTGLDAGIAVAAIFKLRGDKEKFTEIMEMIDAGKLSPPAKELFKVLVGKKGEIKEPKDLKERAFALLIRWLQEA